VVLKWVDWGCVGTLNWREKVLHKCADQGSKSSAKTQRKNCGNALKKWRFSIKS